MARPVGGDWGWLAIGALVVVHNVVAAGRRREMLCDSYRRHVRQHPLIVAAATAGLVAHLYGRLGPLDPFRVSGDGLERAADVVRRAVGRRV
jgi:hypothetical protein